MCASKINGSQVSKFVSSFYLGFVREIVKDSFLYELSLQAK